MQTGHEMKKKVIFLVIIISAMVLLKMLLFHFRIKAEAIFPYNISVVKNNVEFDIALNEGFYCVVDYSYKVENDCLYITFYGSYLINKNANSYISHVSILTDSNIKQIDIQSGYEKVTIWQNNW